MRLAGLSEKEQIAELTKLLIEALEHVDLVETIWRIQRRGVIERMEQTVGLGERIRRTVPVIPPSSPWQVRETTIQVAVSKQRTGEQAWFDRKFKALSEEGRATFKHLVEGMDTGLDGRSVAALHRRQLIECNTDGMGRETYYVPAHRREAYQNFLDRMEKDSA